LQEELEGQRSDSEGEASGEGKQLQRLLKETKEGDEDEEEEEEDEDEEVGVFSFSSSVPVCGSGLILGCGSPRLVTFFEVNFVFQGCNMVPLSSGIL
jgi:hypothetical protein